ncbi:hypothetical protein DCAR_0624537 [Daucus carota subsp. sativus]|uniref:26S proteasome complex subunit SEM1 n=1 Tax=Daucus carota subsp. sativus TaxID=79200 RepID=A0AAF0XDU6_DAUCS|nr:hypothetical protein DCAR_0624537 [Daucus carota subsp. sativus]
MDKETKVATEEPKIDLFEDDDEFEEFEIDEGHFTFLFCKLLVLSMYLIYNKPNCLYISSSSDQAIFLWDEKEGKEATQQWEDDWDDDDVSDDFSLQLRRELESNNVKT